MAHDLKLHIWRVIIRPTSTKNKNVTNYELFQRIRKKAEADESSDPYHLFFQQFIRSFNGEFKKDKKNQKSFAPLEGGIKYFSNKQIICGFLEGGTTGIKQTVKPNKDYKGKGTVVGNDDVVGLPYYFQLWIPVDVNYAYIMIQSYSEINTGIACPFFEHFNNFLSDYTYSIREKEIRVPKPIIDLFVKDSVIVEMDILRDRTSPTDRNMFNPSLVDSEKMKIRITLSGLKIPFSKFINTYKKDEKGNPFFINLSDMGIIDPNDYIAQIKYHDPVSNKETKASLTDLLNIHPTIVLPDEIKIEDSGYPDFDKIFVYCNEQLKLLQLEDGYGTTDEFKG
jgi:hypothetical protein